MRGSEYGEQDRKAAILYEYETFRATEGEKLLDTYLRYLQYDDNSNNDGLFMDNDDDQEIFHDAIESASKIFNENHIVSQTDHDESKVDHNDSEENDVDKLIKKFNQKIAKCQKYIEKANQQNTRSDYACNDAMNVSCNSRLYAFYDVNDLFVFDDVIIRNSQVSKMPFRKKPRDSLNVCSRDNLNNLLPRTLSRCYILNDYVDFGKLKTKKDIGVFVGYSKESASFINYNKHNRKIHENVNVNFDEISEMASKQFNLEQITKTLTMNVENSNVEIPSYEEEVFHESSESFQEEYSSFSLNDDVQQSSKEVTVPSSNTHLVSNESVPNVNEASTPHNVFNERLEDAYFDKSTTLHDPSNVYTFYQPYPHDKMWTKDHPLHKIISDLKSSVRTRGQLANSCLFVCLLSNIEPANEAEALKDADWVSEMQEERD
uniref:Retroviral polymerase SH3-like domain-containing protein n=1 Tax=Tanacetum cinerariifolium TaxID=118510 RepID=A0A6L2M7G4_TANCI|nr:hypothetical protein [Tanacetum cinerariifolium]